ncbi:hypothetical protein LAZ67_20001451, partial [Cordylochernes scorpioides]
MERNKIRAVIKYLCTKGMSPKVIYEDMVDTLREDAPSYSTVKKMELDMEDKSSWEIWSDKNDEAFGIIITTLSNEQAGMFIGETNAKKVWDSLRKTYTGNLEDKIIDLGLELKNIKMKDNKTADEYITRAKNIAARSSSLGHQFTSRELSFYIVRVIHPNIRIKGNSVIFNKNGAKIYNEGNDLVVEAYIKDRMFMMETGEAKLTKLAKLRWRATAGEKWCANVGDDEESEESLRTIVPIATQHNLIIKTYDVKTAYLYGELEETVYMRQPDGFMQNGEENKVCKLEKSLYGLPQSGKCWNKKINEILYQLGMIRTKCDPCVYKLQRVEEYAILGLYVDDFIIAATSKEINDNLATEIEKYVIRTEKKDSEPFIGIEIKRAENGFYLSQTPYIDTILHRFGLEECDSVQTPGDQNQNLDEYLDSKPVDKTVNQEMIGSCADAFRMLTVAYGEATLDRSNVYRWYKMFSEGREDVNDEERAGRPSTSTTDEKINEVEKMILANRRITVREVAEDLNISIGSYHSIFINDLGMRRVAAKFVPKLLNCDQKQHRMNIANEMLDSVRDDPNLLQRVITGDEAWEYGYDVETKAQSSQWKLPHEPRPKKARQVRSNVKVFMTVFFDCRGVVHHEFLPQGRTVNKEYYLQVVRNLREAIRQKRPDLWKNKNWLLHHDNAPAHTSLLVRDFLAKNNTLMMPQSPYSPDLAP